MADGPQSIGGRRMAHQSVEGRRRFLVPPPPNALGGGRLCFGEGEKPIPYTTNHSKITNLTETSKYSHSWKRNSLDSNQPMGSVTNTPYPTFRPEIYTSSIQSVPNA